MVGRRDIKQVYEAYLHSLTPPNAALFFGLVSQSRSYHRVAIWQKRKAELRATGLTGSGVPSSVEELLSALPGVEYVHVNLGAAKSSR